MPKDAPLVIKDAPLVDFGGAAPWFRATAFVRGALRRRWGLVLLTILLFTAVAVAAAAVLPRQYSAQTRVLARKNFLMPALANPRRTVPFGAEAPAQSAAELVRSRDALTAVIRRAGLVDRWERDRPPLMRVKDALVARLKGPLGRAEIEDALVEMLRHRLIVTVQEDVITIRASWPDPDAVRDIVDAAQAEFLAARYRLDIQGIADTRRILAASADSLHAVVIERLEMLRVARARAQGAGTAAAMSIRSQMVGREDVRAQLLDLRLYREELERQRRSKIAELQVHLAQQEATLGEQHPDLVATHDALERLSSDDTDTDRLRAEEDRLAADYVAAGGRLDALTGDLDGMDPRLLAGSPDDDEAVAHARVLLRIAADQYQELTARVDDARRELEAAQAAFPYRLMVTSPAERPRKPDSPNALLVVVGGIMAGACTGLLGAVVLELRSRALLTPAALAARLAGSQAERAAA